MNSVRKTFNRLYCQAPVPDLVSEHRRPLKVSLVDQHSYKKTCMIGIGSSRYCSYLELPIPKKMIKEKGDAQSTSAQFLWTRISYREGNHRGSPGGYLGAEHAWQRDNVSFYNTF